MINNQLIYKRTLNNPKIVPRICPICKGVFYVSKKKGKRLPKGIMPKNRRTCSNPACSKKHNDSYRRRLIKKKKLIENNRKREPKEL